jgi:hypothetical protein
MSRGHSNVIPFNRRPVPTPPPRMMRCPVSASLAISEAIALMWQLREQLQDASGLRKPQRASMDRLGSHIEDHLESALHSMEDLP